MQKKIWIIIIISFFLNEINIFKLLIGNNCDLESDRKVIFQEGKEYVERIDMKFIETSAETEQKVDEAFETLVDEIIRFNEEINNNKEEFEKEKKSSMEKIEEYKKLINEKEEELKQNKILIVDILKKN